MTKKWESEAEMKAELRRIARETRELKEELRGSLSRQKSYQQVVQTDDDERKLRLLATDEAEKEHPPTLKR